MDWNKIKQEYISVEDTSYRKLATKYGVSISTLSKTAGREKWPELKEAARQESNRRIIKVVANRNKKRMEKLQNVADKVLRGIESIVDEALNGEGAQLDKTTLKQITGALKDLKEIHGLKSEHDTREQKARIKKLERDAETPAPQNYTDEYQALADMINNPQPNRNIHDFEVKDE